MPIIFDVERVKVEKVDARYYYFDIGAKCASGARQRHATNAT